MVEVTAWAWLWGEQSACGAARVPRAAGLQQGLDGVCVGAEAVTHWSDGRLIILFKNKSLNNFIHDTNRMM